MHLPENCPAPASTSGWEIVKEVRRAAQVYGNIKVFRAYLELPEHASTPESRWFQLRSEMQASGVSLTDCPHNGRKDVADKMILGSCMLISSAYCRAHNVMTFPVVDMMAHAIDNPAPKTYILISGDRDFAYAISVLGLRGYQVILFSPSTAHISLKSQAATCLDWSEILGRSRAGSSRKPTQMQEPVPSPVSANVQPAPTLQERSTSFSDNNEHKLSSGDEDIINYLRTCRRRRQPSISSGTSESSASESQMDNTTHSTAYFSVSEDRVFSPLPVPREREHRTDSISTYSSVNSFNQFAGSSGSSPMLPQPNPPPVGAFQAPATSTPQPTIRLHSRPPPVVPPPLMLAPSARPPVPTIFKPLVNLLRERLAAGSRYPSREHLALVLDQNTSIYSMAKVERFGQYIALAERYKIVTQGSAGIVLRPEWT
jgi:hypothetical protein